MTNTISIIIVEYFSDKEIAKCVEAISLNLKMPFEIIVSSNSCYSNQRQNKLRKEIPYVTWVFNERNGGFAYAMNQGLSVAKGEYLIIMNPDCIIHDDIGELAGFLKAHPDIGAIAPQIKDESGNIQDTARCYVSLPRYIKRQLTRLLLHKSSILDPDVDYTKVQTVDWIIGAFIMVSRKAYVLTNGLDDIYFMYAEDLDWCTRIRQKGLEIVYFPKLSITYKGTRRARNNGKYAKIFIKSHVAYWKKFGFICGYPKRKNIIFE